MNFQREDFNRFKGFVEKCPPKEIRGKIEALKQPGVFVGTMSLRAPVLLQAEDVDEEGSVVSAAQLPWEPLETHTKAAQKL